MFTTRQEIFMDFAAILSMKFEYCASCVEQPQLIYTVTSKPHSSNPLQNLKATTEAHAYTVTGKPHPINFVVPWYVHNG